MTACDRLQFDPCSNFLFRSLTISSFMGEECSRFGRLCMIFELQVYDFQLLAYIQGRQGEGLALQLELDGNRHQ